MKMMTDVHILNISGIIPSKNRFTSLEVDDIDTAMVKAWVLVLLFQSELPQATNSLMLTQIMNTTSNAAHKGKRNIWQNKVHFMKLTTNLE